MRSAFFGLRHANAWYGFVLGFIGGFFQLITYLLVVTLILYANGDPSLLSLAISMAPSITVVLKLFSQQFIQLENTVLLFYFLVYQVVSPGLMSNIVSS